MHAPSTGALKREAASRDCRRRPALLLAGDGGASARRGSWPAVMASLRAAACAKYPVEKASRVGLPAHLLRACFWARDLTVTMQWCCESI